MLEHLFGSKTRVKLMALFLSDPEKVYFVRELTRLIDTQINAVRREIENLTNIGMLVEHDADGAEKRPGLKRKYYGVNPHFPLLEEIQGLMTKSHFLLDRRLDKEILALGPISYLAFLGLFLGKTSSVDLFIVGEPDMDRLRGLIYDAERFFGFEIKYTCLTPQEYVFRMEISDRFVRGILEGPKHVAIDKLSSLETEKKK